MVKIGKTDLRYGCDGAICFYFKRVVVLCDLDRDAIYGTAFIFSNQAKELQANFAHLNLLSKWVILSFVSLNHVSSLMHCLFLFC